MRKLRRSLSSPDGGEQNSRLLSTAFSMAVIIIAAKAMGLLRDILIANYYGTGMEATAYETAGRLPILLFDLVIGGVVTAAFIPVFNELLVKRGRCEAFKFADSYITLIAIVSMLVAALGMIFAPNLVSVLAPEIDIETHSLAVTLTRIMFPMIIFTAIAFVFVGILQSMGEFTLPALISLVSNSIMVLYLFSLSNTLGIIGLAFAMLLGWASQAFVQLPKVCSLGYRYHFRLDLKSKYISASMKTALPILISTWTQPICLAINTSFASGIENGRGITAIGYSNRLYTIIVGVFSFVATNLLFPMFSKSEAQGNSEESERLMRYSCRLLVYIIAPIAVGIAVLAVPFISLIYERGEFTSADTALSAIAMQCFTVGMPFMAVNEVLVKSFFAKKRAVYPMIASLASMVVNAAFLLIFAENLGIAGIALASGVSVIINLMINLAFALRQKIVSFSLADLLDLAKTLVSSVLMGSAVFFLYNNVFGGSLVGFFASVLLGGAAYIVVTALLRSEETLSIVRKILSFVKR